MGTAACQQPGQGHPLCIFSTWEMWVKQFFWHADKRQSYQTLKQTLKKDDMQRKVLMSCFSGEQCLVCLDFEKTVKKKKNQEA